MRRLLLTILLAAAAFTTNAAAAAASPCASADCGAYAATVAWGAIAWAHPTTGYNITLDGNSTFDTAAAAATSYTYVGMDCGGTFTVGVQAHDGTGDTSPVLSTTYDTPACPGPPPVNTAEPIATGTVATGDVVSTTTGTWTNNPSSYSYQWQDCPTTGAACTNVASGGTSQTYTVQSGDSGDVLRAEVKATNAAGTSAAMPSPMIPFGDNFANDPTGNVDTNIWASYNHHGDPTQPEPECYQSANLSVGFDSGLNADVMEQVDKVQTVASCPFGQGVPPDTTACNPAPDGCYSAAETQSQTFNYEYGTLKAKIQFAGGDTWPALWQDASAVGQYPTNLDSATYCNIAQEIDIAEINRYTQDASPGTVSEEDNGAANCSFPGCSPSIANIATAYHVYEFDWTPTSITAKIDGTTECTSSAGGGWNGDAIPNLPMFPMIDTAMNTSWACFTGQHCTNGIDNSTLPATTKVAWIYITTDSPNFTAVPSLTDTTSAGRFLHGDSISISGVSLGSSMTCGTGGVTCTYLWKRCDPTTPEGYDNGAAYCTQISGATSSSYTLATGDEGDYITASVTASTSSGGESASTPLSIKVT